MPKFNYSVRGAPFTTTYNCPKSSYETALFLMSSTVNGNKDDTHLVGSL
jgi:hypothetical protein